MKVDCFYLNLEENSTASPDSGRQVYLAGEEIKGNVELIVRERIRVSRLSLKLIGTSYTGWQDEFTDFAYESRKNFLKEYHDLTSDLICKEPNGEVPPGRHKSNFRLKIPIESISSIDKEGYGCVKYTILATLDLPEDGGDSEVVAEADILVRSFLTVDSPHFLDPVQSTEQLFITRPWICTGKSRRWIRATLCISSLGLLPGEICGIRLIVENRVKKAQSKKHNKEQHKCALVSLCQQLDFRAKAKQTPFIWDRRSITTAVHSCGICKANWSKKGPDQREIVFEVPSELPATSTKENGLITCSYFFRIEIEEHFDVIVPVVIGSHKTIDGNTPMHLAN